MPVGTHRLATGPGSTIRFTLHVGGERKARTPHRQVRTAFEAGPAPPAGSLSTQKRRRAEDSNLMPVGTHRFQVGLGSISDLLSINVDATGGVEGGSPRLAESNGLEPHTRRCLPLSRRRRSLIGLLSLASKAGEQHTTELPPDSSYYSPKEYGHEPHGKRWNSIHNTHTVHRFGCYFTVPRDHASYDRQQSGWRHPCFTSFSFMTLKPRNSPVSSS